MGGAAVGLLRGVMHGAVCASIVGSLHGQNGPESRRFSLHPVEADAIATLRAIEALADGPPYPSAIQLSQELCYEVGFEQTGVPHDGLVHCGNHFVRIHVGDPSSRVSLEGCEVGRREGYWFAYAWPVDATAPRARTLMLSCTGALLVSDDETDYAGLEHSPPLFAAVELGASGAFADVLPIPGRGAHGDHWAVVDPRSFGSCRIEVVDETGQHYSPVFVVTRARVRPDPRSAMFWKPTGRTFPVGSRSGATKHIEGAIADDVHVGVATEVNGRPVRVDLREAELFDLPNGLRIRVPRTNWTHAVMSSLESVVITTLRHIHAAQTQCQACGVIDADADGIGEFGFFGELSGATAVRAPAGMVGGRIEPPVLPRDFARVRDGRVVRNGYVFRIGLPGPDGVPLTEVAGGGGAGARVDPDVAERRWCCYAWPERAGETGARVFVVTETGDVLAAPNEDGRYSGDRAPTADAARVPGERDGFDIDLAAEQIGRDGQRWTVAP